MIQFPVKLIVFLLYCAFAAVVVGFCAAITLAAPAAFFAAIAWLFVDLLFGTGLGYIFLWRWILIVLLAIFEVQLIYKITQSFWGTTPTQKKTQSYTRVRTTTDNDPTRRGVRTVQSRVVR